MAGYRLESQFVLRLAGAPMEVMEALHAPLTIAATRALIAARDDVDRAATELKPQLRQLKIGPKDPRNLIYNKLDARRRIDAGELAALDGAGDAYNRAVEAAEHAAAELERVSHDERERTQRAALRAATPYLQGFGLFSEGLLRFRFDEQLNANATRAALRYLQRLCTKNDTISEYGPTIWGHVDHSAKGLQLELKPGIARRTVFFERWVVEALAEVMTKDPDVLLELAPRVHAHVIVDERGATFLETGVTRPLTVEERALLARIDGATRAGAWSIAERATLAALAADGVVVWKVERIAMDVHPMEQLAADIAAWPAGAARSRWQPRIASLVELQGAFARGTQHEREQVIETATRQLAELGVAPPQATRSLYAARNVLGENCAREGRVVVGGDIAKQLVEDAAPLYDLWRDLYSLAVQRATVRMRELVSAAPGGRELLPAFLARCAAAGIELRRGGLTGLTGRIYAELKQPWLAELARGPDAHRRTLTPDELAWFRRHHQIEPVDDFARPSIDVQISAPSLAAVARGDYEVVLAEVHPGFVQCQNCFAWSCTDPEPVRASLERATRAPKVYFGQAPLDNIVHNTVAMFQWMPRRAVFASPGRRDPSWPSVPPREIVVAISEAGDVRMVGPDGRDLGSFTASWYSINGSHPFLTTWAPHTPRLYVGRVIFQRETWVVAAREAVGDPAATRIERLRAAKGLPRFIYIRPTREALTQQDLLARDKDLKPIFVDLESHFGIATMEQWLRKFSSIECVEMLPEPGQIPWATTEPAISNELRMLIDYD